MNRSILLVGIGIFLAGCALIASPIAITGQEQFSLGQEAGLFFLPPAFAVMLVGSISDDPRVTTVGGAFGNPDAEFSRSATGRSGAAPPGRPPYHPHEPVRCRNCSVVIAADLAGCPRCGRPRECRTCGRPLGIVIERPTCPACARPEALCNCPHLPPRTMVARGARSRRV
ncbi:MAG: hypothetical protein ACREDE_00955 [Thermoplasmata archaeon]